MRFLKKFFVILLTATLSILTTSCGFNDKSWALKYENNSVSNGTYIYFLWTAYNSAQQQLSDENGANVDLSDKKIDDKDANTWIKDLALKYSKDMLATEKLFDEKGLTLSEEEIKKVEETTVSSYENLQENFTKYGISSEDFKRAYAMQNMKSKKLFDSLYNKNGSEAVSDEEILNYYKTNYVNLSIMSSVSISNPESNDESQSGEKTKTNEQIEEQFKNYANMINSGKKSLTDVGAMFKESEKLDDDPISTETLNLKNFSDSNGLLDKLKNLELNKSTCIKINDAILLVYKNDINNALPDLSKDEERDKILLETKSDDFDNLLKSKVEEMKIQINESVTKDYLPSEHFKEK